MIRNLVLSAGMLALAASTPAPAQPDQPTATASGTHAFTTGLDDLVRSLDEDFGSSGIAIALIENGRIVEDRYYGLADVARDVRMSRASLVNVASVSKAVSALGVMRLADRGRVDLDVPVFERITRWRLPPSEFDASGVTAARLLSHTSGMSRHTTGLWTVNDRLPTLEAALSGDNGGLGDTRLIYAPGTRWSYSGGGYSILQLLVEETTGQSFADYMNQDVLPALGIATSGYGWRPAIERLTVSYYDEFGTAIPAYRTVEVAAGGFNANAHDLAQFAITFSQVQPAGRTPPLSPSLLRRMMTPVPAGDIDATLKMDLGLFTRQLPDGRTLVLHDGGNPGSGAYFAIEPATGNGIAILVNRSRANQIFGPIACAWRNATARTGAVPEVCPRELTGILGHIFATQGSEAARARYEDIVANAPQRFGEQQIIQLASQFGYVGRIDDAITVLRWHLARDPNSAAVHDTMGDALLARGNREGAREEWTRSLRINADQPEVRQKLSALDRPAS